MSEVPTSKSGPTTFSEDEQNVAGNAFNCYKANQFDAALGILKKLQKNHLSDPRLMHNRALTDFCKSGKTKVADFKKSLVKIQKMLQQKSKEEEDIGCNDKINYVCMKYNQALLLFSVHQHSESESILERLYENYDSLEDATFLKISLLLVDNYLITHNATKAGNVIATIEKNYLQNDENEKHSAGKTTSCVLTSREVDSLRMYVRYLKSCCFLQLKSVKACKREIKSIANLTSSSSSGNLANSQQANLASAAAVFLKSNFEYMKCNYHKAYKLLGCSTLPSNSESPIHEGVSTMYYNNLGVVHFHMNKHNLGTFYLQKALHENEQTVSNINKSHHQLHSASSAAGGGRQTSNAGKPLSALSRNRKHELLYNCGLLLLHAGNSSAAFDCLLQAVHAFHSNPRLWLRLAECCVQKCTGCGKDDANNHRGGSGKKSPSYNQGSHGVVGAGHHRKVIVKPVFNLTGSKNNNTSSAANPSPTMEFAAVCLRNALIILQNAKNRASSCVVVGGDKSTQQQQQQQQDKQQQQQQQQRGNTEEAGGVKDGPWVACLPGAPLRGDQVLHLRAAVLTNLTFVALQLGNSLAALHYADALLALPRLSGQHRYLAHMYAAEALVSLDRISEAIQHLSVDRVVSVSAELDETGKKSPVSDDGSSKSSNDNGENNGKQTAAGCSARIRDAALPWHFPATVGCAHAYMLFNLAASHCLRSEHDKALRYLKQASGPIGRQHMPPQALLLAVYLNLNGGGGLLGALQVLHHHALIPRTNGTVGTPFSLSSRFRQAAGGVALLASAANTAHDNPAAPPPALVANNARSKPGTPQPQEKPAAPNAAKSGKNSEGGKQGGRRGRR